MLSAYSLVSAMTDYSIFYKTTLPVDTGWPKDASWDLFVSAYNSSERVKHVFDKASAAEKHWLIFPDYGYEANDYPHGQSFAQDYDHESDFILAYADTIAEGLEGKRICVDITGFIKPYMMFLLRWLAERDIPVVDILYSEPAHYIEKEETRFSDAAVAEVRQVAGFEGVHSTNTSSDVLVIGAGYDHELIAHAAKSKDHARKIQVFGWPSLRADMYQENVLRAHRAAEAVGAGAGDSPSNCFAPANDPFAAASVLHEIVERENAKREVSNLYLCPLATKPQALGFTLYYLTECRETPTSIIYPFCHSHSRETSRGVSRIWKYTLELPASS